MAPSSRFRAWSPCSIPHRQHHHHHPLCHHHHLCSQHKHHHHLCSQHKHHHHPLCHHHHLCSQHKHHHHQFNCLLHLSPGFAPQPARNPKPTLSHPLQKDSNLEATGSKETSAAVTHVLQETECDVLEEEEDDDPIFVLTDEWREFFARSEAKRNLEKKHQAKKKEKH